jgi:hypothetical protein
MYIEARFSIPRFIHVVTTVGNQFDDYVESTDWSLKVGPANGAASVSNADFFTYSKPE